MRRKITTTQRQFEICMGLIEEFLDTNQGFSDNRLMEISDDLSEARVHLETFIDIRIPKIKLKKVKVDGESFYFIESVDQKKG